MEDILHIGNYEKFMVATKRNIDEFEEKAFELNQDKMERAMEIVSKLAFLSNGDFLGTSLVPDDKDLLITVRCASIFPNGANVVSLTPYLKMFRDVTDISVEPLDGHILIVLRMSNVYEELNLEEIEDDIIDTLYNGK